ncbi:MAG: type IV pilin protein [Sumerlaeia bacterium]
MKKSFTLIELLIVVAIIAILASIAVPNFLEAQTRSKISAARADMRTIATALEIYALDNNRYPPEPGFVGGPAGSYVGQPELNGYNIPRLWEFKVVPPSVTTPISYLTSLPQDPFKTGASALIPPNTGLSYDSGNSLDKGYIYLDIASWVAFENPQFPEDWANSIFGRFGIVSLGPDKIYNPPDSSNVNDRGWIYDATNGTVSAGLLVSTQSQPLTK